jgi:hypothetical protein
VSGIPLTVIGPATCVGAFHEVPPLADETCLAKSWHVARVQLVEVT